MRRTGIQTHDRGRRRRAAILGRLRGSFTQSSHDVRHAAYRRRRETPAPVGLANHHGTQWVYADPDSVYIGSRLLGQVGLTVEALLGTRHRDQRGQCVRVFRTELVALLLVDRRKVKTGHRIDIAGWIAFRLRCLDQKLLYGVKRRAQWVLSLGRLLFVRRRRLAGLRRQSFRVGLQLYQKLIEMFV